jgi:septal ring-binding cell division protein DamX
MVPAANADVGVSVAVAPEILIVAATFVDPALSVNVDDVNVALAIARLKVAETVEVVATPLAPDAGDWLTITGGAAAAVVKLHVAVLPKATPLVSVTVLATVAVYVVPVANADVGVSVAVAPETLIVAATFVDDPAARTVNVEEVNVELFIVRLKVTETLVPVETPVAPAAGD